MAGPTRVAAGEVDGVFDEAFEGPEKTLTLCFKSARIVSRSLRLIPRADWEAILQHACCEILSSVDSCPADLEHQANKAKGPVGHLTKKQERAVPPPVVTKGITAYLLSESSLFLSDTMLSLKTCGRTTPLIALEPILDRVVPKWRSKDPESYLKYASFTRLGYMFPGDQPVPHTSWSQEVEYLDKHLQGESVILGSKTSTTFHAYVANYLPKGEMSDAVSTQVALTNLMPTESFKRFAAPDGKAGPPGGEGGGPLRSAWTQLHGDERRSVAAKFETDERFFEPVGYSANGVFGRHFTTIHATPQPCCSYASVETTMPLTSEGRRRFVTGAEGLCRADTLSLTEFSLSPMIFLGGGAPEIPGFEVKRSTATVGPNFACSLHHYSRIDGLALPSLPPAMPERPLCAEAEPQATVEPPPVVVEVPAGSPPSEASLLAAQLALNGAGAGATDITTVLLDVGDVRRRANLWRRLLPRVEPFYAVKCNPNPAIVKTLWNLWQEWGIGGFDCASPSEMELVLALGVDPTERIVYANPCKQGTAVSFARDHGVRRVVFDNHSELEKLQRLYPDAELLLRVQTDDSLAQCPLSNKFGVAVADCRALLERARTLGLKVVGVSFHVGSGCSERGAFKSALRRARTVFDEAERAGFEPFLLDIGGGFPGWDEEGQASFADHAEDIGQMLEELFPSPAVRVIAEPGRFFAAAAQALLTSVISVADATMEGDVAQGCRYYLNDGLYGSFNCLIYDHASVPEPIILRNGAELRGSDSGPAVPCTLFGPTCDGFDKIHDSMALPRLRVGDRLLFRNMGAYTNAASTSFNGFSPAETFVYESRSSE